MSNEDIKRRQAECDCPPDFHVCTAIAEMKRLEEWDRDVREAGVATLREEIRVTTLAQAKVIKMGWPALEDFCNQVIELLSKEDEDGG
jgi:hypothetical protein